MVRKIIIALLLIGAIGYGVYTYWPFLSIYLPVKRDLPKVSVKPAQPAPIVVPEAKREDVLAEDEEAWKVEEEKIGVLTDPFSLRIAVKKKKTAAELKKPEKKPETKKPTKPAAVLNLEGIWVDSGMKVALISGQSVSVGATVNGWRVVKITRDQVVLRKGRSTKILRLEGIR